MVVAGPACSGVAAMLHFAMVHFGLIHYNQTYYLNKRSVLCVRSIRYLLSALCLLLQNATLFLIGQISACSSKANITRRAGICLINCAPCL